MRDLINAGIAPYNAATAYFSLTANITLSGEWTPIGATNVDAFCFKGDFDGNGHTISGVTVNRPAENYNGLFGFLEGTVRNLGVAATINGGGYNGGIAGLLNTSDGSIYNCFVSGAVTGSGSYTGGVVGRTYGMVKNCFTSATVAGTGEVGGIAGLATGDLLYCYATGAISGTRAVGGIAGYGAVIVSCVALNPSITRISGSSIDFGRVTGSVSTTDGNYSSNLGFVDMQAAGGVAFTGSMERDGRSIKSWDGARQIKTYQDIGWQFSATEAAPWNWLSSGGYMLPTLWWQTTSPVMPGHL